MSHTHEAGKGSKTGGGSQYKALALYHNLPAPLKPEPGFHIQSVLSSGQVSSSLCSISVFSSRISPEINRCGPKTSGTVIFVPEM